MKWLGLTCLTIASRDRTANIFNFLGFALSKGNQRPILRRRLVLVSHPTQIRQSAVQSNRLFILFLDKFPRNDAS